jgi:hypothetical protein
MIFKDLNGYFINVRIIKIFINLILNIQEG